MSVQLIYELGFACVLEAIMRMLGYSIRGVDDTYICAALADDPLTVSQIPYHMVRNTLSRVCLI